MSEELQRLQMLDHNVQQMTAQKQQFQSQLFELENALKELASSPSAYKIIGNIMVMTDKTLLQKELNDKKELKELARAHGWDDKRIKEYL